MKISIQNSTQNFLIENKDSILDALLLIEANKHGIVFAIDSNRSLVGSLSDGDLRRSIIQNISLSTQIKNVVHSGVLSVSCFPTETLQARLIEQFVSHSDIRVIPVLAEDNTIISLAFRYYD